MNSVALVVVNMMDVLTELGFDEDKSDAIITRISDFFDSNEDADGLPEGMIFSQSVSS